LVKSSGKGILGRSRAIRAPEFASAFSRTFETMLLRRIRPMSPDIYSAPPAESTDYERVGLRAGWDERTVTVVAVSLAVLIVAVIAVLMGMT
jgi:hypothetical protein